MLEVDLVELAASDEGHDEVEAELVLEEVVHADEEGVLQVHHDVHLRRRVFDLLLLDQDVFSDGLDRIELAHTGQLSQVNPPECAPSNYHDHFKVVKLDFFLYAQFPLEHSDIFQFVLLLVGQTTIDSVFMLLLFFKVTLQIIEAVDFLIIIFL